MGTHSDTTLDRSRDCLAEYIDHTLLKPEATAAALDQLCAEAIEHEFHAVCVNGYWAERCARTLADTAVKLAVVVGFPLGAAATAAKAAEARLALENGAHELDMVMNIGALKSGQLDRVRADVRAVRAADTARTVGHTAAILKVIIETALLTDEEKRNACRIAVSAGADFVKTSTGFAQGGATVEDVRLMRRSVGPEIGVKASGGIRTREDALAMIRAGATRIGTSSGVAIVEAGARGDESVS